MKLTYKHTKYAAYTGYITQAIVNNLPALLFAMFNTKFGIPLEKIGLLVSINFGVQILVDFLSVKFIDRIGYRVGVVGAHIFAVAGLLSLDILPRVMGRYLRRAADCRGAQRHRRGPDGGAHQPHRGIPARG